MLQDTTSVKNARDLTNFFEIVAGFTLMSQSETKTLFTANGSIISVQDLNNDTKINGCLSQGCNYFSS